LNTTPHIAICDDEPTICKILSNYITKALNKYDLSLSKIELYTSPIILLGRSSTINLLFLDLEMSEMDGITVARKIHQLNPKCRIVISTSHSERYKEAFTVNAFRYITKPFNETEIEEVIRSYCREIRESTLEIDGYQNRVLYRLKQLKIEYIQAYNGYVEIHTTHGIFRKDISLDQLEQELDKDMFFRIHRSYIVGLKHIISFSGTYVVTSTAKLPVARRTYTNFKKRMFEFDSLL